MDGVLGATLSPVGDLVAAAIDGDRRAYRQLVEQMSGVVWKAIREVGVPDSDASDVAQTVWLHMVEHLAAIRDPERLPGWLARTARNECYAWVRRNRRRTEVRVVDDSYATVPEPDERLLAAERRAAVVHAFVSLEARDRELLTMLVADPPVPYRVISDATGIPIASIGPTRARCLEKLRRNRDLMRVA